ncbi:MAG: hypothetical protein ACRD2E_13925 [Terriglobales bacterium]
MPPSALESCRQRGYFPRTLPAPFHFPMLAAILAEIFVEVAVADAIRAHALGVAMRLVLPAGG